MPAAQVMTVTGALPADELGATDAHEHLFLRSAALPGDELEELEPAIEEAREGADSGLRALIELTPIGCGRRPDLLRAVSQATGLAIVAASGYHRDAHYASDHWVHGATVDELAQRIVADLTVGMDGTNIRAGVVKAGASYEQVTDSERRRLLAAVEASRQSGAAVVVHTEAGTFGPQIVELLLGAGLPAERLTLAHLDRNPDPGLHAEISSAGVSLVYDTIGREKYGPDAARIELIARMVDGGHAERLMLALDLGRRGYFRAYGGGPGLRHLLVDFVPRLRERIGAQAVETMLVRNPARAFALAPVRESVA